jgi:subtilisin family serine protease
LRRSAGPGRLANRVEEVLTAANLRRLLDTTQGDTGFRIALLDGVIDCDHPSLRAARIEQDTPAGFDVGAVGKAHATFLGSMLVGTGDGVLGLCRECMLLSIPVADVHFEQRRLAASDAARRVAKAINEAVRRRADVIQLSLAFDPELSKDLSIVAGALSQAARRGIVTIVAAGTDAMLGASNVLSAPGVIPVAAADLHGRPHLRSALGRTLGMRGLLAPGVDIPGAFLHEAVGMRSGSSFAAALVTGTLALLQASFPAIDRTSIVAALCRYSCSRARRSIVPPKLDGEASFVALSALAGRLR